MLELQHRNQPTPALTQFLKSNSQVTPADFDSVAFQPVKQALKKDLNVDQGGLCVYCEKKLKDNEGQLEHIKPKSGKNAHPELCFLYSNLAQSCINRKTCGQQKKNGILPIEPSPSCNTLWILLTDGTIEPIDGLSRKQIHTVRQTRDMLGLNNDANLVDERKRWFESTLKILQHYPEAVSGFLEKAPYRDILTASLPIKFRLSP